MSFLWRLNEGRDSTEAENDRICQAVLANEEQPVVEFLNNGGAVEKVRDPDYKTLLHLAAFKGHLAMLQLLLQSQRLLPLIDCRDRARRTALHLAAAIGDEGCVRVLVAASAKMTCQDKIGSTPLHLAVKLSKLDTVKALLELDADPMLEDKEHQSSKDLADSSDDPQIASLMSSFTCQKPSGFSVKKMIPTWLLPGGTAKTSNDIEHGNRVSLAAEDSRRLSGEEVLCRGAGHVRCSHCYYTERFGRHKDCVRQCGLIHGSWGPGVCAPECKQMPNIQNQQAENVIHVKPVGALPVDHATVHVKSAAQCSPDPAGQRNDLPRNSVDSVPLNSKQVLCRGPGHVRCTDCYYTGRFGRHRNCTRQCCMIQGSWGPLTCVQECGRKADDEKQETVSEVLTCVSESGETQDDEKQEVVEESSLSS